MTRITLLSLLLTSCATTPPPVPTHLDYPEPVPSHSPLGTPPHPTGSGYPTPTPQSTPTPTPTLPLPVSACSLSIYFEYDSALVFDEDLVGLRTAAECMKKLRSDNASAGGGASQHTAPTFTLAGHADERGTSEYNYALGTRRAAAVAALMRRFGVPSDFLDIVSYGEDRATGEHDRDRRVVTE